jgi:hypothetical protein
VASEERVAELPPHVVYVTRSKTAGDVLAVRAGNQKLHIQVKDGGIHIFDGSSGKEWKLEK